MDFQKGALKRESLAYWKRFPNNKVAGYLEGEGIFCGRINKSETLQVAYPQLYSVTEKTKQSEDQVCILPTPGSVSPWSNAIFDCMSTALQVFASFLFR